MSPSDPPPAEPTIPASGRARAGETIVELSFALLLVGVWLVTCLAG